MEGYFQAQDLIWIQAKRHRNLPINTFESLLHPILLRIAFGNMLEQANLENNDFKTIISLSASVILPWEWYLEHSTAVRSVARGHHESPDED